MTDWKITNTKFNPQTGYILSADYICSKADGEHSAQVTGDVFFTEPRDDEPASFAVPFDDVTEEMVVGWTKDKFGAASVKNIEDTVAANLVNKMNPKKENGLPWAAARAAAEAAAAAAAESSEEESSE